MEKIAVSNKVAGKEYLFATGELAKQANGSILAQCGESAVLITAVAEEKAKEDLDFFPLTVNYVEKAFAAGKIPGGFIKREGRATDYETLISRLIDRALRPRFPEGFKNETQVIATVLSLENENRADVLALNGASLALSISNIPFNGPIGAVRIILKNGSFVINPSSDIEDAEINLFVAGTENALIMVEGEAKEADESEIVEALDIALKHIKEFILLQKELIEKINIEKMEFEVKVPDNQLKNQIMTNYIDKIDKAIFVPEKLNRKKTLKKLREEIQNNYEEDIGDFFKEIVDERVRYYIVEENRRIDGRSSRDVRSITCQVGIFKRVHGSAVFTRGETQAFVSVTLGTGEDEQIIDSLTGEESKRFMLHYNFPPFSVGEVGFLRAPGRREIGHGYLAERALSAVIPSEEDFPYTMRIVSEILESNGSSSMATVCGGSLSLMDAGVPIKAPIAGIAMGLIVEGDKYVVLSDILGDEDHLGDMDFKVAGSKNGITAIQMDIKIAELDFDILKNALIQAKEGRLHILEKMNEVINAPRAELSPYAPRLLTMQINPDKIRDIIGPSGKTIKNIIDETGAKIDIDQSGSIKIFADSKESLEKTEEIISTIVKDLQEGDIVVAKVIKILDFGAILELKPGSTGLLHISEIENRRINKVTDVLNLGDEVKVKIIKIERDGKIKVSKKSAE
jgi:polyribonucleotide nucleotidyltransferase